MIELAKHIEVLLLENDCVIVPGLGGFIAHNRPATWRTDSGEFFPPLRSIGFNPQLIMNDGLLVQSYMQAYNTDFPDATRKIEKTVETLKEELYQRGQIALQGIGTLYYNMKGGYGFEPEGKVFFTPSLYGLEPFSLPLLKEEVITPQVRPATIVPKPHAIPAQQTFRTRHFLPVRRWLQNAVAVAAAVILFFILSVPVENTYVEEVITPQVRPATIVPKPHAIPAQQTFRTRHFLPVRRWLQNAVAVAAAVILFFILSVPVENTYVEEADYAALGSAGLFDAIRNQSLVANTLQKNNQHTQQKKVRNNVNTLKPVKVKTEKVAAPQATSAKVTAQASGKSVEKQTPSQTPVQKKSAPASQASASQTTGKSSGNKGYYIIAASLTTAADASRQAEIFRKQGYKDVEVLESAGRYRVSLGHYTNQAEAYRQTETLKKEKAFSQAWVFSVK